MMFKQYSPNEKPCINILSAQGLHILCLCPIMGNQGQNLAVGSPLIVDREPHIVEPSPPLPSISNFILMNDSRTASRKYIVNIPNFFASNWITEFLLIDLYSDVSINNSYMYFAFLSQLF